VSAATKFRHITDRGGESFDRPALASILAGTKWYRGTVVVGHGSRMMAYPTNGFNNANTPTAGGPLQVAGADGNGGLRLIAKRPNVRFELATGAAASVIVTDTGATQTVSVVVVTADDSDLANSVVAAVRAHAAASQLLDIVATGNGSSVVGTQVPIDVPFVRLLGLANGDVDNSASVADVDVDNVNDYPYTVRRGVLGLEIAAAMSLPGPKFVTDNQTITENYAALLLPIHCDEIDDGLGYCLFE
jgi:hypothetical protein